MKTLTRHMQRTILTLALCAGALPVTAQVNLPPAAGYGSDGSFAPTGSNYVVNLAAAPNGAWSDSSPVAGQGTYDPEKWAVVFKYSNVVINAGTTVTFSNHLSRAPVVWLVNGNVTINGTLNLNGKNGGLPATSEPGPGGFRGGIGALNSLNRAGAGFGPGGGKSGHPWAGPGAYGTPGIGNAPSGDAYGNSRILRLLGGSGGGGEEFPDRQSNSGGAGGGAILLAATGTITINGTVIADGGNGSSIAGSASGGAIRLIANTITGSGTIRAIGGSSPGNSGGNGRVRLEANIRSLGALTVLPQTIAVLPGSPALVWAAPDAPVVTIKSIASLSAPIDLSGRFESESVDLVLTNVGNAQVVVETRNMPTNSAVTLRVVPRHGAAFNVSAAPTAGSTTALALWQATVGIPNEYSVIQVRAVSP